MKMLPRQFKNFFFYFTAILAGICIFASLVSSSLVSNIFSDDFHKQLFEQNNIYKHAEDTLKQSITKLIEDIQSPSTTLPEQLKDILYTVENILTPQMIRVNLDNIRGGIFKYFKGDNAFLPDIALYGEILPHVSVLKNESISDDNQNVLSARFIKSIDKINLSALLVYINRTDISDHLMTTKLVYWIISSIPQVGVLACLFLLAVNIVLDSRSTYVFKWLRITIFACGLACILTFILLIIAFSRIPLDIFDPFLSSVPLGSNIAVAYLKDLFQPVTVHLLRIIVFMVLFLLALKILKNIFKPLIAQQKLLPKGLKQIWSVSPRIKNILLSLLLFSTLFCFSFSIYAASQELKSDDLSEIIEKLRHRNTQIKIIPAENSNIFALLLKVVDRDSGKPVEGIEISISGKSKEQYKVFNEQINYNNNGYKIILDRGTFRCSFINNDAMDKYYLPSPFYFDIKQSGTTIITVYLDKKVIDPGIIEVEVLDENYEPVEGIKLKLNNEESDNSDSLPVFHTVTNSEGIGVFKVNKGIYDLDFVDMGTAQEYELPSPFTAAIKSGQKDRYTISLVKKKM